jgi:tetratricopeptide (TPR) repeat protein
MTSDPNGSERKKMRSLSLPRAGRKRLLRLVIPVLALVAAALLILVFEPFRLVMGPKEDAAAQENSLAVMYFENIAERDDPERLGEIVTNLLITDLSGSQYMTVVSSQRLYDILKMLGRDGAKVVDRDIATDVAARAGAKYMLLGSILQTHPEIVLTSQLVAVESGRVIASHRVSGGEGEKIFSVVDRLTVEIRESLKLPAVAREEIDLKVADVTTSSPQAYRYWLDGVDNVRKVYLEEAEESFRKALEYDSTFAMAYYQMAMIKDGTERLDLLARAVRYSDKASPRERYYIKSLEAVVNGDYQAGIDELAKLIKRFPDEKEAYYMLATHYREIDPDRDQVLGNLTKAVALDPNYKDAYNLMAYTYNEIGDFEKAIWAIDKYITLAPDEPNPLDTRGDIYAYNGKLDQAKASYAAALDIRPDFYPSVVKLGHMHLFRSEYAAAESVYSTLLSSSDETWRSAGRAALALIPMYRGKLGAALDVLDSGLVADKVDQIEGVQTAAKHWLKSMILGEQGKLDESLREFESGIEVYRGAVPTDPIYGRDTYCYWLAKSGRIAKAEEVALALGDDVEGKYPAYEYRYWLALGAIAWARGTHDAAVDYLERAAAMRGRPSFTVRYGLAEAYLNLGRLGEAVDMLEKLLGSYDEDRASSPVWGVKAHYLLGQAYERSGWTGKAVKEYEEFLKIWRDADRDLSEVKEAASRLKQLKGD